MGSESTPCLIAQLGPGKRPLMLPWPISTYFANICNFTLMLLRADMVVCLQGLRLFVSWVLLQESEPEKEERLPWLMQHREHLTESLNC